MWFFVQALPFAHASLSWRNIGYTVQVKDGKKKVPKELLHEVSGAAPPGRLVALMGSTGGAYRPLRGCQLKRMWPPTCAFACPLLVWYEHVVTSLCVGLWCAWAVQLARRPCWTCWRAARKPVW